MRWRKVDAGEKDAVQAAREDWDALIAVRDALGGEKGTLNMERAKKDGDFDAHANWDGRTPRYVAASDAAHEAYVAILTAEQSYFRLNMWGMGRFAGLMAELGMTFADDPHPPWPDIDAYGLTYEQLEVIEYPDYPSDVVLVAEQEERARKFLADRARVLAWHGRTDTPGIPDGKFGSNDGWIVLPAECEAALRIYMAKLEEAGEEAVHNLIDNRTGNRGKWAQWLCYLQGAMTHDGFEVH
jgi:hypothetical protein